MSGTLKVTTLQDGGSSTANLVFDTNANTTAGGTVAMSSSFKRNRIINGNMVIDQRNAGASVATSSGTFIYTVDRWQAIYAATSKYTIQQNAGSVTLPAGFTKYLGVTSTSAYTPSSTEYFAVRQFIEGYNTADLAWGAASAKAVTLSFLVYSSLTGSFGGALVNSAQTRSYPFTYSVPVANTWTTISITVPGDTTGVWATDNATGIDLRLGLGCGSTYNGTAGAWAAGNYVSVTGAVSVVGTSGATFYITGVQLEVGTKATPYEMQIYSDQLAQCQRYFSKSYNIDVVPGTATYVGALATFSPTASTNRPVVPIFFPVSMRTTPTLTAYSPNNGASGNFYNNDAAANFAVQVSVNTGSSGASWLPSGTLTTNAFFTGHWTATAEL